MPRTTIQIVSTIHELFIELYSISSDQCQNVINMLERELETMEYGSDSSLTCNYCSESECSESECSEW